MSSKEIKKRLNDALDNTQRLAMKQMRDKQREVTKTKIHLRKDVNAWNQEAKDRMDTDSDSDSEDQYDLLPKTHEESFKVTTKYDKPADKGAVESLPINDDAEDWKALE